MHIQCTQEKLKKAIYTVERVTGKNGTLPILENILLQTKDGFLHLTATNLEVGISTSIGVKIEHEGSIAVPVTIFSQFINNLPSSSIITLKTKENTLYVVSDRHSASMQGFDSEDFPLIPKPKNGGESYEIRGKDLRETLMKNTISISPQDVRVEFTGVFCGIVEDGIIFASTDSFRLTETRVKLQKKRENSEKKKYILPGSTVSEIIKLLDESVQKVVIIFEEQQVFLMFDDSVYVVSRLISGTFPEYTQIIPETFKTEVFVNSNELEQAVKLSGIFSQKTFGEIFFQLKPQGNQIVLETKDGQSGKNVSKIPAEITGNECTIVFNPKYILDALHIFSSEKIGIFLNTESSPAVFRGCSSNRDIQEAYKYILMPIKK